MIFFIILYSSSILASFNSDPTGPVTYEGLRNILASFANGINKTIEENLTESEQRTLRNVKKEIDTITRDEIERQEKNLKNLMDNIKTSQSKKEDTKEKERTINPSTNPLQNILPLLANSLGSGNNNDLIMYILYLLNYNQNTSTTSESNPNILTSIIPIILQKISQRGITLPANQNLLGNTGFLGACNGINPLHANLQGYPSGLLGNQNIQGGINPAILQSLLGASFSQGSNLDPNQVILLNILIALLNNNTPTSECPLQNPPRPTSLYGPSLPQNMSGSSVPQYGYGPTLPKNGYGPSLPEPSQTDLTNCHGASCANGVETREYSKNYGRRP